MLRRPAPRKATARAAKRNMPSSSTAQPPVFASAKTRPGFTSTTATITSIGLIAVLARRAFGRLSFQGRLIQLLPALSALVIVVVGIGLTVKALPEVM